MAYQGKFSQPRNTEENIRLKEEARKQAAVPAAAAKAEPARQPAKTAPAGKQPEMAAAPVKKIQPAPDTAKTEAAPVKKAESVAAKTVEAAPAKKAEPASVKKAAPAATSAKAIPAEKTVVKPAETQVEIKAETTPKQTPTKKSAKKKKKKSRKGNRNVTIVFYTLYFVMVAAFLGGMFFLNNRLNDFLVDFQASQPTTRCEEIFRSHFENPDWNALYEISGLSDTPYEGADAFAAYMVQKSSGKELSYVETSAGLSGGRKYLLKLGNETLGYFTLKDNAPAGSDLPDWQLDQIKLSAVYNKSVMIQTAKGHQVSVNGVALDDTHIIEIATTLADKYLPKGISAPTTCTYLLEGLMAEPEIIVTDEEGTVSELIYDENAGIYIEQTAANTMGEEERSAALNAAQTYAKYMIEEANYAHLAKCFDSSSKIYKTITSMTLWMQGHDGYEFANEEVTQYCRYSDKYFSARVSLSLNVTRRDGTVKEYTVDSTLFFLRSGKTWKVYEMTNADVSAPVAEVRLTFKLQDHVVFTNLFDNNITTFKAPTVTVPEGKAFAGWYLLEVADDGSTEYTLVFAPEADGTVTLPAGTTLEPMTLHALFEDVN